MKNGWRYDSTRQKNYFSFFGKMLYDQLINLPNRPRKNPVAITYPYRMDYKIRAILPDKRSISSENWEIKRAAYEIKFSSKYLATENVWELHYEYVTLKDYVEVAQVAQFRKDMEKLTENLDYELTNGGSADTSSGEDLNISIILLTFIFLAGYVLLCLKMYKYSPVQESGFYHSIPIGGWLGLLGLGLVFSPFTVLSGFFTTANVIYFDGVGWNALQGQSEFKIAAYHLLLVIEAMGNLFFASFAILLIILFFKKRSSFPILFSIFAGSNLLFVILDTIVTNVIFKTSGADETAIIGSIVRQIVYAAIWIPYLNKSDRVKKTFVISYDQQHADFPNADAEVV